MIRRELFLPSWTQSLAAQITGLRFARILLSFIGVGSVVLGAIIAWHVSAATPLLIVGAVLAALGLFKWKRIGFAYGELSADAELSDAQEQISEAIDDATEVATRPDIPLEVASELDDLRTRLIAAERQLSAAGGVKLRPRARAFHQILDDVVVVGVSLPTRAARDYRCEVVSAAGEAFVERLAYAGGDLQFSYPRDFAPRRDLRPGMHSVKWGWRTRGAAEDMPWAPFASDTFAWN